MKKKIVIYSSVAFIIILMFFYIKINTNIYLELVGNKKYKIIDMTLLIDQDTVYNKNVIYHDFRKVQIEYPLSLGLHKITVFSEKARISKKKHIFLFFNQYILVSFYEGDVYVAPEFVIRKNFNPFYIE